MIRPQLILDLHSALFVDNFAGGGGASTGAELALGRAVDIAVNHNGPALSMHAANHPQTLHLCDDVFRVKPREVTNGRPVGGAWFSPDCTDFSGAKGGKPKSKRIRGLAWVMLPWAYETRPGVMFLENVKEFAGWGPLDENGNRIKEFEGRTFGALNLCMGSGIPADHPDLPEILEAVNGRVPVECLIRGLGYHGEWRKLRACDYGTPTSRQRLFGIFRCDGQPIVWPEPTHADPKSEGFKRRKLKPWRTAAECIDFTIPCPSIFLGKAEAKKLRIKRPLAAASQKRIAKGVKRHVMDAEEPFIVNVTHGARCESCEEPFKTITGANRGEKSLVDVQVAAPFIGRTAHGEVDKRGKKRGRGDHSATEPLPSVLGTQDFAAIMPVLAKYHSAKREGDERTGSVQEPLPTQDTENRFGIAAVHVARQFGTAIGHAADQPLATTTSQGGGGKSQVVATFLAQHNTGVIGHEATEPFSTLTGTCSHQQLVAVSLLKYYGTHQDPQMGEPLHTGTTKARFGVSEASVAIPPLTPELAEMARRTAAWLREQGIEFEGEFATTKSGLVIVDIGMRMFMPRELFNAQGFPANYIIDPWIDFIAKGGRHIRRRLSKTEQVEKCGNSVCPPIAEVLIAANVPEMSAWNVEERKRRRA